MAAAMVSGAAAHMLSADPSLDDIGRAAAEWDAMAEAEAEDLLAAL